MTESFKRRVVLPFAGSLAETDHVLGHELVHAFQYAMTRARSSGGFARPDHDAPSAVVHRGHGGVPVRRPDRPAHGHVDARRGHEGQAADDQRPGELGRLLPVPLGTGAVGLHRRALGRSGRRPDPARRPAGTGTRRTPSSGSWASRAPTSRRSGTRPCAPPTSRSSSQGADGRELKAAGGRRRAAARMNVAPALSPDGKADASSSRRRACISLELYLADATSGRGGAGACRTRHRSAPGQPAVHQLGRGLGSDRGGVSSTRSSTQGVPALRVLRDGERADRAGDRALRSWARSTSPTWSPDGQTHRVLRPGRRADGPVRLRPRGGQASTRLTEDTFADLQPAWSPDGKAIAFVTDRFSTDLKALRFGSYRLALIDPETKKIDAPADLRAAPRASIRNGARTRRERLLHLGPRGRLEHLSRGSRATGACSR